jgi:aromatic ring-opening dioxygenase catalytic subunit (LigB family)
MASTVNTSTASVIYISHGGGPLPLLGDPAHQEMVAHLRQITELVEMPSAIIVISAHWEEDRPTITAGAHPELIYDYYGFPDESYEIQYPAPGDPALASDIFDTLRNSGIDAVLDARRGFDHGLFVPLKIMYPQANIPCVQLSLVNSLSPAEHIRIGQALAGLSTENILVVGSGFSFHNLKAFFAPASNEARTGNESFEHWLIETCTSHTLSEQERQHRLIDWESAPAARYCHPREEHLLPLHVCYGFAGSAARQAFSYDVMGKKSSSYLW